MQKIEILYLPNKEQITARHHTYRINRGVDGRELGGCLRREPNIFTHQTAALLRFQRREHVVVRALAALRLEVLAFQYRRVILQKKSENR